MLVLNAELKKYFANVPDYFAHIMSMQGEVYRAIEGRCTQRIVLAHSACFVKQHTGVGWYEIFKNLLQFKWPVLGAKNEWFALQRLQKLNIAVPEVMGYGWQGVNPARQQSFIITRELPKNVSLEDFCRDWPKAPPSFCMKQRLIREVAHIARTLHTNGINHRDFYICHFLLDLSVDDRSRVRLYLIDLHRAQLRTRTPRRWRIKDLAGLFFSSKKIGLTQRDLWRFIEEYRNKPLSDILPKESHFWMQVKTRGDKLYKKYEKSF